MRCQSSGSGRSNQQQRRFAISFAGSTLWNIDWLNPVPSLLHRTRPRRLAIIKEEFFRRQVADHSMIQIEQPALWQALEKGRLELNRETALLNRRLRAEGLRPIELEPSLPQRVKKLQQLDARKSARTATRAKRS
jgi:hypothetical protein